MSVRAALLFLAVCLLEASEGMDGEGLLLPPLVPFPDTASALCRRDYKDYIHRLNNLTLWAAQMFDSNGKLPTGVLYGATYEMGNFDECLSVEAEPTFHIRGQYCLAQIDVTPPARSSTNATSSVEANVWHKARTCSPEDVQDHLSLTIRPMASALGMGPSGTEEGPSFSVLLLPSYCTTLDKGPGLSAGEICMCSIIAVFIAVVLLASIWELMENIGCYCKEREPTGLFPRILRCFSSITNVRRLTSKSNSSDPFAFVNGLKVMTMFLIIFGHRFIFNTASPLSNSEFVENLYGRADTLLLMGGTVVVDSFLIISGCLLVYLLLGELNESEKGISISFVYTHRFIRLTPVYMIVVAFYATLFPRIGDGPLWKAKVGMESDYCAHNWWTNFLYINTFVNPRSMCMIQSWYMAVDMHLFLVGVPVTFLLHRRPAVGKALLGALTTLSAVVAFGVTYLQQLDPILLVYFKTLQNLREDPTFKYSYIQSYMRALPYFMGMIIGYLVHKARKTKSKIPKKLRPLFLAITVITCLSPIFGSTLFLNPKHRYNVLAAAVFNPVHRASWAGGLGIIIYAEATGSNYPITKILRWSTIVPLSRITYSAFLVHAGIQIYSVNTRRVLETASMYSLFSDVIADTSHTFILAFIFSVIFEAPLLRLEKLILENALSKGAQRQEETQLESVSTIAVAAEDAPQQCTMTDK